jgi:hypothetical protein
MRNTLQGVRAILTMLLLPCSAPAQGPNPPQPVAYSLRARPGRNATGRDPRRDQADQGDPRGRHERRTADAQGLGERPEFTITLPQPLPQAFTLEFDLVPKGCCSPQDLSFEGTPTINQGAGSAHVLWDSDGYLAIIGGGADQLRSADAGGIAHHAARGADPGRGGDRRPHDQALHQRPAHVHAGPAVRARTGAAGLPRWAGRQATGRVPGGTANRGRRVCSDRCRREPAVTAGTIACRAAAAHPTVPGASGGTTIAATAARARKPAGTDGDDVQRTQHHSRGPDRILCPCP